MNQLIVIFAVIAASILQSGSRLKWTGVASTLIFFFLLVPPFLYIRGPEWNSFLNWEITAGGIWDLSDLFSSFVWNDLSFLQKISPPWITRVMAFCYDSGYIAMFFVPSLSSFLRGDSRLGWKYIICGHLLQSFLIVPVFYFISVQEIWWVKHVPDGLYRSFTSDAEMLKCVYNCFPSMHVSVATAMLIIGLNEPNRIFRYCWMMYCVLVIISTVYFPIHWLIDLIGGVILGIISTKLGNKIVDWYNIHIYCNLKRRISNYVTTRKWNQI